MNNMLRLLALAFCITITWIQAYAQDKTQGKIHYELTYNIHANLKPDQMQYKDLIPATVVEQAELIYNGQRLKSFFVDAVEKEDEGVKTNIRVATDEGNERYIDIDSNKVWWIDKAKTPQVLVEKSLEVKKDDRIQESEETRVILSYTCRKRVVKPKKDDALTIWYTTDLPLKAGTPFGGFTGPGVILAMESKRVSFKATSIDFVPVAEKDVTPPGGMKIVKTQDHSAQ